ncbi:hypothetical protein AAHB56_24760, partial [Bacillus thuringiensis]
GTSFGASEVRVFNLRGTNQVTCFAFIVKRFRVFVRRFTIIQMAQIHNQGFLGMKYRLHL